MNLLAVLKEEVQQLQLTDKVKIKDYLYYRTGMLFNYDPLWAFVDESGREELRNKRFDIENITDFNATCYSWSYMFVDLLLAFCIPARVIKTQDHALVESYINGETYISDLMIKYQDIKRIKFGMETCYNFQKTHNRLIADECNAESNNVNYETKEVLNQIKTKLDFLRVKSDLEEYVYLVFKTIETFMNSNFSKSNIGYVEGLKFIYDLLQTFISEDYRPSNVHFFHNDKKIFIEVYAIARKEDICYFVYKQNEDNLYELKEISKEEVEFYVSNYSSMRAYNLSLGRKVPKTYVKENSSRSICIDRESYETQRKL